MAILFILGQALPAHLVGGCGARAVSRKTPIYFMIKHFLVSNLKIPPPLPLNTLGLLLKNILRYIFKKSSSGYHESKFTISNQIFLWLECSRWLTPCLSKRWRLGRWWLNRWVRKALRRWALSSQYLYIFWLNWQIRFVFLEYFPNRRGGKPVSFLSCRARTETSSTLSTKASITLSSRPMRMSHCWRYYLHQKSYFPSFEGFRIQRRRQFRRACPAIQSTKSSHRSGWRWALSSHIYWAAIINSAMVCVAFAHGNNLQAISEGKLWKMDRQTFRKIVLKSAFQVRKKSFHMWNHLYTYLFFRSGRCTNHSCLVFRFLNTWMWVRVHSHSRGTSHEWKVFEVYWYSCQRLNQSTWL